MRVVGLIGCSCGWFHWLVPLVSSNGRFLWLLHVVGSIACFYGCFCGWFNWFVNVVLLVGFMAVLWLILWLVHVVGSFGWFMWLVPLVGSIGCFGGWCM